MSNFWLTPYWFYSRWKKNILSTFPTAYKTDHLYCRYLQKQDEKVLQHSRKAEWVESIRVMKKGYKGLTELRIKRIKKLLVHRQEETSYTILGHVFQHTYLSVWLTGFEPFSASLAFKVSDRPERRKNGEEFQAELKRSAKTSIMQDGKKKARLAERGDQ